jgi:hypothetical protein
MQCNSNPLLRHEFRNGGGLTGQGLWEERRGSKLGSRFWVQGTERKAGKPGSDKAETREKGSGFSGLGTQQRRAWSKEQGAKRKKLKAKDPSGVRSAKSLHGAGRRQKTE